MWRCCCVERSSGIVHHFITTKTNPTETKAGRACSTNACVQSAPPLPTEVLSPFNWRRRLFLSIKGFPNLSRTTFTGSPSWGMRTRLQMIGLVHPVITEAGGISWCLGMTEEGKAVLCSRISLHLKTGGNLTYAFLYRRTHNARLPLQCRMYI